VVHEEIEAVQRPPDHVGPAGPVPKSSQEHGDKQINVTPDPAFAIAAQWHVDVVAQEA